MSFSYWLIEGIGIEAGKIEPFINKEKLAKLIIREIPDDESLIQMVKSNCYDALDVDDFLYGCPFDDLADLLTHCDDTDTITYGNDGENGSYFYYPPSMPWHRKQNEPRTLEEVHRRIIKAVKTITDLSSKEIEKMIDDDLYVVGCG